MTLRTKCYEIGAALLLATATGCLSANSPIDKTSAPAKSKVVFVDTSNNATRQNVKSWKAIKQSNIVMQQYDYSCGAAALATMFRYYFEDPVSEDEILRETLKSMTAEEIRDRQKNGLSMKDLFQTAKTMGYLGAVYRLPVEKISKLSAPVIVRIEKDNFKHFVVLRGVVEDQIYLADPVRGNIRLSAKDFLDQWSGEALILGKKGFGLPKDYPLAVRAKPPIRNDMNAARRWLVQRPLGAF